MYKRIIAPVDGSEVSDRALDEAIKLAKEQTAQLRLVHVLSSDYVNAVLLGGIYGPEIFDRVKADGNAVLRAGAARAKAAGVESQISFLDYQSAQIGEGIISEATKWHADLIVMGTHGRRGIARAVMGSDAEYVVRHTTIPVLLLRA